MRAHAQVPVQGVAGLEVGVRALLEGRLAPTPEDVAELARPVLAHRMALGFAARAQGVRLDNVIDQMVNSALRTEAAA